MNISKANEMSEYHNFKYGQVRGVWCVVYPSGFKTFPPNLETEDDVKALIDQVRTSFGQGE